MDLFKKKTEGKLRMIIFPRCSPAWTVIPLFMRDFQCPFYSWKVFFIYYSHHGERKRLKKKNHKELPNLSRLCLFSKVEREYQKDP